MVNLSPINDLLNSAIEEQHFPGAVYLIVENSETKAFEALGNAVVVPEIIAARTDTIYDLASLTKPLVTALLCVQLSEGGKLVVNSPVATYLPEFNIEDKREITVQQLLTHCSGLPAWQPLYAEVKSPTDVLPHIANIKLENEPGTKVVYSDLGYITLGKMIERMTGADLAEYAAQKIFKPLGLNDTCFNPHLSLQPRIAATEEGNKYESAMAGDAGKDYSGWRNAMIWGEVHDGNAYFLGGVAGHAGLFATASDILKIARQFLPGSNLLKPESLPLFSTNFTPGCGVDRSVGWSLATNKTSAGSHISRTAFGHSGFTGTSLWIDPEKTRIFILLTNRVHPRRSDFDMDELRREFHNRAVDWLDKENTG
ncbi:MAG TPA: serine hydrolase domain-containing protein [Blastocatellia bacterium]|nr:serine hydrolase domain-containing protein [Blastocatellia bacterium]